MNAFRRCFASSAPLAGAMLFMLGAVPVAAANECLSITATGALSTSIFVDGFESGNTAPWSLPSVASFDLEATGDLAAEVVLDAAVTGDHVLELRWKLADGQLYQSVAVPFSVGAVAHGAKRLIAGYPFPVDVVAARPAQLSAAPQGSSLVASALPVAGTQIVESGLDGDWYLEASLDESEALCGTTFHFRLAL